MYIKNNICYAGELEPNIKIQQAKPLQGRMLLVEFSTGEKRLFDTTQLAGQAFQPLTDNDIFRNFKIFHGIITWKDGEIDIAPETIYKQSIKYDE